MPSTYTLISSNVLSSSAASVTFSAIPGTYTDLVLRSSIRTDKASLNAEFNLRVNGLTTSIYSNTFLTGNGATAGTNRNAATTRLVSLLATSATATSNTFTSQEIYIPSYTASQNKPLSVFGTDENNATTAEMQSLAGLIATTAAITEIQVYNNTTVQFVAGSSFYLYGLKSS